jgi:hypothetical protein
LRNPGTDLPHDLLDIDVVAMLAGTLLRRLGGGGSAPLAASAILPASPAMKVLPTPVMWILISHR